MEIKEVLNRLWGVELLKLDFSKEFSCNSDIGAIILACNSQSFARFQSLDSFEKIFKSLEIELNKYNIQSAQAGILLAIKHLKIRRSEIIANLNELVKNEILSLEFFEIVNDFLLSLNFDEISLENTANAAFHRNLDALNEIVNELKNLSDEVLTKRLENAYNSANNATFNIALSGVINAGKSSLLNALIGQNLLGVSNVPQTASICVLKYANEAYAKVDFLDISEQEGLEKKELSSKNVSFDELEEYTGAKSELVKYVKACILGLRSDILKDINIIDTPGIDDAIKAREELSRQYLKSCDSVLYLMNGAQACTKKDMDFLKSIVANTKNSEILVVLSHIDKLAESERTSVLEYTQKSVLAELSQINEELAKNVKYFLVSALANIGINELKAYIFESFFGQSSKRANIILSAYKKEIKLILSTLLAEFESEARAFSWAQNSANDEIIALKEQSLIEKEKLEKASVRIENIFREIDDEKISLNNDIASISSKIADRVINELKYRQSKKEKVDNEKVFIIANSAFKDFLVDLLREKKQILEKKLQSFSLIINELLSGFAFEVPDFKTYLDNSSYEPDFSVFKKHLSLSGDLEKESPKLKENLKNFLANIGLEEQINSLLNDCAKEFKTNLNVKFTELKDEFEAKNLRLENALNSAGLSSSEINDKRAKCLENVKILNELEKRLNQC